MNCGALLKKMNKLRAEISDIDKKHSDTFLRLFGTSQQGFSNRELLPIENNKKEVN
jgi:hypothetical protein